jgi:hypothetical protein
MRKLVYMHKIDTDKESLKAANAKLKIRLQNNRFYRGLYKLV